MVYKRAIPPKVRAYIMYHGEQFQPYAKTNMMKVKSLSKKCQISRSSVYRLLHEPLPKHSFPTSRKGVGGRKKKLTMRAESLLLRKIPLLRKINPNWTASDLMSMAGIEDISLRTAQRILNRHGYHHLKARRKGILSLDDAKKRLSFAREMKRKEPDFWQEGIAFYFDGVGFIHRRKPKGHALACRGMVWRKRGEGLQLNCTSKGQKEGYGGKQVKFFVAISYNRGIICAEQYTDLNAASFSDFIYNKFREIFRRSAKTCKEWLQDGDPSQNSVKAQIAMESIDAKLIKIPPRSPDLNPIENVFAHVKKELRMQVLENDIEQETYDDFALRVKATLYSSSSNGINTIIDSMGQRLSRIIVKKGGRIEY